MPYANLLYHVIFATKHRQPLITAALEPLIHHTLRETLEARGALMVITGGVSDHVHLLLKLPMELSIQEVVREAKLASTRRARVFDSRFKWGRDFAVFSVNYSHYQGLVDYIRNQKRHHGELQTLRPEHEWEESA